MTSLYIPRDILMLIFKAVDDPKAYHSCCLLNKECATLCKALVEEKMNQFSTLVGTYWEPGCTYDSLRTRTLEAIEKGREPGIQMIDLRHILMANVLPNCDPHGKAMLFNNSAPYAIMLIELTFHKGRLHGPYSCSTDLSFFTNGNGLFEGGTFENGLINGTCTLYYSDKRPTAEFKEGKMLYNNFEACGISDGRIAAQAIKEDKFRDIFKDFALNHRALIRMRDLHTKISE